MHPNALNISPLNLRVEATMDSSVIESFTKRKIKTEQIPSDEFLTTKELMQLLKIKQRRTVYSLIKEGLPSIFVGRSYRFIKKEVIVFLKGHSAKQR